MMRYAIFALIFFITSIQFAKCQDKFDFDETKIGFNSPDELARSFVSMLVNEDTTRTLILKHFLNKEAILYMIDTLSKVNEDAAKNRNTAIAASNNMPDDFASQPIFATRNLLGLIHRDTIKLKNAIVKDILYDIRDQFGVGSLMLFTEISILIEYKEIKHKIELGSCIRLKNKWFIAGTSLSWDGNYVAYDRMQEQFDTELYKKVYEKYDKLDKSK